MKLTILNTGEQLYVNANQTTTYPTVLPVWGSHSFTVRISEMAQGSNKTELFASRSVVPGQTPTLKFPPVDGAEIDLSVLSSLMPEFTSTNKNNSIYIRVWAGSVPYTFIFNVINIDAPNFGRQSQTDFKLSKGRLNPVSRPANDRIYSRTIASTNGDPATLYGRDGNLYSVTYQQGSPIDVTKYYRIAIPSCGIDKVYPDINNEPCGRVTLSWFNSCGSFDFIDADNFSCVDTLAQQGDGRVVTKREVTCNFGLNAQNVVALKRLAVSPEIKICGMNEEDPTALYNCKCSSTTGVKSTGSGLTNIVTLKFIY